MSAQLFINKIRKINITEGLKLRVKHMIVDIVCFTVAHMVPQGSLGLLLLQKRRRPLTTARKGCCLRNCSQFAATLAPPSGFYHLSVVLYLVPPMGGTG